jgi:hypothetical protein
MINDFMKWVVRTIVSMVCWVFILSIRVNNAPLFQHGHDILVDNSLVRTIDRELGELWYIAKESAKGAMASTSANKDQG